MALDTRSRLSPVRRWWLRLLLVLVLAACALAAVHAPWYKRTFFVLGVALWLGTFPQGVVSAGQFERSMVVLFVPLRSRRWSLDRFRQIETDLESLDPETAFWIGGGWWLVWWLCDRMVPWLGGEYKLWLRAASGARVLAWRGNSERDYQDNLDLLRRRSGLPVARG
jgi:hypothetical protein